MQKTTSTECDLWNPTRLAYAIVAAMEDHPEAIVEWPSLTTGMWATIKRVGMKQTFDISANDWYRGIAIAKKLVAQWA